MPYERIDVRAATEALDAAAERLSAAKTIEEAEKAFAEREKIISHVQTMSTIAYIRHTVNTLDEFYEKENDFNDEKRPRLLSRASRSSPRRCSKVRFARSLKRNTAS